MASKDISWREYHIHDDDDQSTNNQEPKDEEDSSPVDIFAPREEDAYKIHKYNFDVQNTTNETVTITLREQDDYDVSTGMSVWKGSEILCQYLIEHPDMIRNKRVLELGAGVGLCGIVSASKKVLGASSVLLTDGDHCVLRNLRYNVELNYEELELDDGARSSARHEEEGVASLISCPQLIWGKTRAQEFEKEYGKQDVIMATDCVYVTKSVRPLFETVDQLLALSTHNGGVFLFVNSCASICSVEHVISIGEEFGFVTSPDELWYQPGNEEDPVYVFRRR